MDPVSRTTVNLYRAGPPRTVRGRVSRAWGLPSGKSGNTEGPSILHVSQADIFRQQFGRLPLPPPDNVVQPPQGGSSPPDRGPILSAHAPRGGLARGGTVSWDPGVFRPYGPVSCYSREIFSDGGEPIPVSAKPGQGFKKPECGQWVRKLRSGEEVRDIYHNCGSLSCPACMPGTLTDKARDVEDRFDLYEQAKCAENAVLIPGEKRHVDPRQFIFTMSPSHIAELVTRTTRICGGIWDPERFLDIVREEFGPALKASGLLGGFMVYHDARVRHPDTDTTGSRAKHLIKMEAMLAGNMEDTDPSWMLYDHIRKQKRSDRYYYFSPHFHVIAFGKAIPVDEFEKLAPGWTYHNKGPVKNPGGLARYLFSHMALLPDKKSCSWFGRLSSRQLGKAELRTVDQVQYCEETGLPWIVEKSVILEEIGREYTVSVTEYQGFFRPKKRKKDAEPPDIGKKYLKMPWPGYGKRPAAPYWVREKGILAMAKYCDEWGKL